jgi:hypothetical protein
MAMMAAVIGVAVALLAVFGLRPHGGKQVSNTQMMTVARVVLVVAALVLIYLGVC